MKTNLVILLIILLLTASCSIFCEDGTGNVQTQQINVSRFEELEINAKARVNLKQAPEYSLVLKIDSNLIDFIKIEEKGGKLEISETECIDKITDFQLYITTPNVKHLELEKTAILNVENTIITNELTIKAGEFTAVYIDVNSEKINIDAQESSLIKLSGVANTVEIDAEDAVQVDAYGLRAKEVDVDISQTASCKLYVTDEINGDIDDEGQLYYKGNPKKVKTDIHDRGVVKPQ